MQNNPIKDFSKMPLSQLRIEFDDMIAKEVAKGLTGFSFTDRAQIKDTGVHGYELERQRLVGILTMHANSEAGNYEEYCPPIHPQNRAKDVTNTIR